jgi:hypothetical protein
MFGEENVDVRGEVALLVWCKLGVEGGVGAMKTKTNWTKRAEERTTNSRGKAEARPRAAVGNRGL